MTWRVEGNPLYQTRRVEDVEIHRMPGRLRSSFRSGNLAEHLGMLLLKGIAAVADVPRTEDVGLDAVASLLRRDIDGNCYAEDSFVVQLKSDSTTSVEYRDHELQWLLAQSLPMFLGLVSLKESRLSLYPTLNVNAAVLALHSTQVTIRFGKSDPPAFLAGTEWSRWSGGPGDSSTVWLGEPLLEWRLGDLTDPSWSGTAYEVLKRFLSMARREHDLLALGQCSNITWSTNDQNSIRSTSKMIKGHPDDLPSLAHHCKGCLHALFMQGISMPEQGGNALMIPLISLTAALREIGVDIDQENLFAKFFFALRSRPGDEQAGADKVAG